MVQIRNLKLKLLCAAVLVVLCAGLLQHFIARSDASSKAASPCELNIAGDGSVENPVLLSSQDSDVLNPDQHPIPFNYLSRDNQAGLQRQFTRTFNNQQEGDEHLFRTRIWEDSVTQLRTVHWSNTFAGMPLSAEERELALRENPPEELRKKQENLLRSMVGYIVFGHGFTSNRSSLITSIGYGELLGSFLPGKNSSAFFKRARKELFALQNFFEDKLQDSDGEELEPSIAVTAPSLPAHTLGMKAHQGHQAISMDVEHFLFDVGPKETVAIFTRYLKEIKASLPKGVPLILFGRSSSPIIWGQIIHENPGLIDGAIFMSAVVPGMLHPMKKGLEEVERLASVEGQLNINQQSVVWADAFIEELPQWTPGYFGSTPVFMMDGMDDGEVSLEEIRHKKYLARSDPYILYSRFPLKEHDVLQITSQGSALGAIRSEIGGIAVQAVASFNYAVITGQFPQNGAFDIDDLRRQLPDFPQESLKTAAQVKFNEYVNKIAASFPEMVAKALKQRVAGRQNLTPNTPFTGPLADIIKKKLDAIKSDKNVRDPHLEARVFYEKHVAGPLNQVHQELAQELGLDQQSEEKEKNSRKDNQRIQNELKSIAQQIKLLNAYPKNLEQLTQFRATLQKMTEAKNENAMRSLSQSVEAFENLVNQALEILKVPTAEGPLEKEIQQKITALEQQRKNLQETLEANNQYIQKMIETRDLLKTLRSEDPRVTVPTEKFRAIERQSLSIVHAQLKELFSGVFRVIDEQTAARLLFKYINNLDVASPRQIVADLHTEGHNRQEDYPALVAILKDLMDCRKKGTSEEQIQEKSLALWSYLKKLRQGDTLKKDPEHPAGRILPYVDLVYSFRESFEKRVFEQSGGLENSKFYNSLRGYLTSIYATEAETPAVMQGYDAEKALKEALTTYAKAVEDTAKEVTAEQNEFLKEMKELKAIADLVAEDDE